MVLETHFDRRGRGRAARRQAKHASGYLDRAQGYVEAALEAVLDQEGVATEEGGGSDPTAPFTGALADAAQRLRETQNSLAQAQKAVRALEQKGSEVAHWPAPEGDHTAREWD